MSMPLDLPTVRRAGSLSVPSPSPPINPTASSVRSVSRSSSYGGLVFRGQSVKVTLPNVTPETLKWIDNILLKVRDIHDYDEVRNSRFDPR
jgi:hypothetical protein